MARARGKFLQAVLILVVAFLVFKYGIRPPMPFSLLSLYMAITLLAVLVYVSSDSESWRAFVAPIWATLAEPRWRPVRLGLGVLLPLLVGYYAYSQAAGTAEAPVELRAIHPAPPASISFRGKQIDLGSADTPVRKDAAANPANKARHVGAGGALYIQNCMYCHGDNLDGHGHFAHGFNPAPADFTDPGTIAQLSEGFLFWRIAKGGPGLPKESTPWNSAMPAWEDRLTEEQIWQVIYYLYDATGYPPRVMSHSRLAPAPGAPSLAGLLTGTAGAALAPRPAEAQAADAARGKQLYEAKCALCHGAEGKGDGPAAERLLPRPRDFTAGKYKIRTTSGALPTDEDLVRIIRDGMPGTSMPAWGAVIKDAKDMQALVAYVKGFAEAFKSGKPEPVKTPSEVGSSEASIKRGKELFEAIECNKCHGQAGRGDPAPGSDLKDDWGNPVRAANLHKAWTFRGGHERKDVVMRLVTGVAGTPMPTFAGTVDDYKAFKKQESEEKKDPKIFDAWKDASLWDLASYVRSLGPDRPNWASLLTIPAVTGEVPSDPNAEFWKARPGANFPLVGQVIVDPRNFNPTIDMVTVRAVHTPQEIVFHLTWDDPSATDPGKGAPKPDMLALQLPTGAGEGERPYFLMGDSAHPVYLLTWRPDAGPGEATATGVGKLAPQSGEAVQVKGQGLYDAGQYRAVLRRPLKTAAPDFAFPVGQFFPMAFWAWDGSDGDEGARAAISTWYYVRLEAPSSKGRFVIPFVAVLATVGLEYGLSRWAQRRRQRPGS